MDSGSLVGTVTQNVKKRVSKWDLVEDPQFPTKTVKDNSKSGDATGTPHDKDLNSGWNLSKSSSRHVPNWSEMEGNHAMSSKDPSGESGWVIMPEGKSEGKDDSVDRGEKISLTERTWSGDQSYGASNAPPYDAWRQSSRSRSPKSGWGRSRRSRSRSPHDFKHEGEGWTDRSRSGRGGSAALCREFAAGRCRRGYQCRFLHQDDRDYDRRHFDSGHSENRGRRLERGGFSRYAGDEAFTDSQEHGYEGHNDKDREKHERQRNSRPSARCNDFLKGKCYRGSSCKYVHHGMNPDAYGGWSSKDATGERGHSRREDTFGHDQRREPRRSGDILCKYFAEGRCRNGERCKFSHQDPSHGGPEGQSQNAGWGESSMTENRSREGPRWSDKNSALGAGSESQLWNGSKWGDNTGDRNLSSDPLSDHLRWGDKDAEKNGYGSPWSSDDNNPRADDPGNRSWKGPSLGNEGAEMNVSNSPPWKGKDSSRRDVSQSGASDRLRNGADMASAGLISENYSRNIGRKESTYNLQDSETQSFEAEGQEQHVSTTLTQPVASKISHIQQHPGLKADVALFSKCNEHNETNFSGNNLPTMVNVSVESAQNQQLLPSPASNAQSGNPNEENQRMAPPNFQNLKPDDQNQQIVLPPLNVQNFNTSRLNQQMFPQLLSGQNVGLNGQSQPMTSLLLSGQMDLNGQSQQLIMQLSSTAQSQTILDKEESNRKPDLPGANAPELTSGNSVPQNAMPTEKGTRVTDLSASLAQIFGNGQQLPQLYATLNHLSATGLVPCHPYPQSDPATPSALNAAPLIHPDQGSLPQKQYDTVLDSTESVKPDISNQPPRFPMEIHEQAKLQVAQAITTPLVTAEPDKGGPPKIGSVEKPNHENQEMSTDIDAVEAHESVTVQQEQETGHLKDMDGDDQVDDEGRRTKDPKGMKMFKFALVEFIKEILKPTWKEGHMSREAHKTIVKKVVDKVTGSIQGPLVPQTQEKIDHYLSYSKPKLTKLVHAYVEKYLKI